MSGVRTTRVLISAMSWKPLFARTFGRRDAPLHFAAHSHHPWPDVTYDAQINYWRDTARFLDEKWEWIANEVRPRAAKRIAGNLNLATPETITFAHGAGDLLQRVLCRLPPDRTPKILTSDSEPPGFALRIARLEEGRKAKVTRIAAAPFESFSERFMAAAGAGGYDLVWLSHVFFDSGFVVPALEDIVAAMPDPAPRIVFDGHHSFMAIPVDLRPIEEQACYLASGYAYAMAGEGICFMHVPAGMDLRNDGGHDSGTEANESISAPEVWRFDGSGADPAALYRLTAVLEWFAERGLTVDRTTDYVRHLQILFLDHLLGDPMSPVHTDELLVNPRLGQCGRFLTFQTAQAGRIRESLRRVGVIVDHCRDRLRIGFGIYQTAEDVDRLISQMRLASRYLL